jgi:predicted HTH transcriptional regulator
MRKGGESDPRNKALMKMFNLINIGERSGSGVPNIFNIWEAEGWKEPVIEERFDPDRTVLTLEFVEKQAIKTSDKKQAIKTSDKKQAIKTSDNIQNVRKFLKKNGESKTSDIAAYIGLSPARTRAILGTMDDVEPIGENRNRRYKLKE